MPFHTPPPVQLPLPFLRTKRQLIQFGPRFLPGRIVFLKDGHKAVVVRGFHEMGHFVDNDVLKQVLGFFDQLCIEADMAELVIAASPFGFHALEKVAGEVDLQLFFPFFDEWGNGLVQEFFVPVTHVLCCPI